VTTTDDPRDEGYLRLARELPGFVECDECVLGFVTCDECDDDPPFVPDAPPRPAVIRDEGAMGWLD
jgi:hypothetical protein